MFRNIVALAVLGALSSGAGCASLPDKLIWKNEDADRTQARRKNGLSGEVAPSGLEKGLSSPITPEEAKKTALSRPKVVKIQELGENKKSGKPYFEVVDEGAQKALLAPVIDESARPTRVVTYDNNAVMKDYPMRYGVVWDRAIDSLLELPLRAVDRSSGIITTGWLYDERKDSGDLLSLNPFGAAEQRVRYRYNVRFIDRGSVTQIKVVPFAEVVRGRRWEKARPSIVITNRMFERIEREISIPLPGERF